MAQRRPNRKAKKATSKYKAKTSMRQKLVTGGVILLALLFAASMYFSTPGARSKRNVTNPDVSTIPNTNTNIPEPAFVKEGTLQFLKNGEAVKTIDIEIADNPKEIEQGLMFRKEMAEDRGMLFLLPELKEQKFWMKNTIISLDIIYLDPNNTIVSIQKNTTPYSEAPIPSNGLAQYVLEVNAGFCDKFGIGKGDRVEYQILPH